MFCKNEILVAILLLGCCSDEPGGSRIPEGGSGLASEYNEYKKRTASWEQMCDWMATSRELHWEDSFVSEGADGDPAVTMCFSPEWGYLMQYETTAIALVNNTDRLLEIKGFPPWIGGVDIDGPFDLSRIVLDHGVRVFNMADTHSSNWDYTKAMPEISPNSNLDSVELKFRKPPCSPDEERDVPILDVARFSGIDTLREFSVSTCCPVANLPRVLANSNLRQAFINISFDRKDYGRKELADEDEDSECYQKFLHTETLSLQVDDANFDELFTVDYDNFNDIRLEINLSKPRHLSIRPMLSDVAGRHFLYVVGTNCIIDDLECLGDLDIIESVCVSMEISLEDFVESGTPSEARLNLQTERSCSEK